MLAPPPWRFRCYRSPTGKDEIREWYENESYQFQHRFLDRLEALKWFPPNEWKRPPFSWLSDGIGEIRFIANNVQQRPLGMRGQGGADVFTILFPAIEKGNRFIPRDALARAIERQQEIKSDPERFSIPCWLFEDTRSGDPGAAGKS